MKEELPNNVKQLWMYLSGMLSPEKHKTKNHSSKFLINGIVMTNSADTAKTFKNYFSSSNSSLAVKVSKSSKTFHGHKNEAYF